MRVALAQLNLCVGDLTANVQRMRQARDEAKAAGAQLVVFPELAICGYPPEDLLLHVGFLHDCWTALEDFAADTSGIACLAGYPQLKDGRPYNAAALLADGYIRASVQKMHLPTYGVFDESRTFAVGELPGLVEVSGVKVGVTICEDIWLGGDPMQSLCAAGAQMIVNLSASPYHRGKGEQRECLIARRAADHLCPVLYCNMVGGQDELIFDGQSLAFDPHGRLLARGAQFAEDLLILDIDEQHSIQARLHEPRTRTAPPVSLPVRARVLVSEPETPLAPPLPTPPLDDASEVWSALVLGIRDYLAKNGFQRALLGLSGGIDSGVVSALAVDALGAENVTCVVMPSPHSSEQTQEDARHQARVLGAHLIELPIGELMAGYESALAGEFQGLARDVTEENLQARIRGNLLMALSNKTGAIVLSTGNKSEMSVGYSTLYGDLCGGLAVLKDVPKTLVYQLAAWRNTQPGQPPIPESIITRPPTAELSDGQQDTDSLPPYDILDPILELYVEQDQSRAQIIAAGFDEATVGRVLRMVDLAEYKRRQSPPGIRVTTRNLSRDRRMPITNHYRR